MQLVALTCQGDVAQGQPAVQDMERQLAEECERAHESAAKHKEDVVALRNELQSARDQV